MGQLQPQRKNKSIPLLKDIEFDVLGTKVKMKPLKLLLKRDSYIFMTKLALELLDETGLTLNELKDPDNSVFIFLVLRKILKKNLISIFATLLDSKIDWAKHIKGKEDDCLEVAVDLYNNFFIKIATLAGASLSSLLSLKNS